MKEMSFRNIYGHIYSVIDETVSKPILVTPTRFAEILLLYVALSQAIKSPPFLTQPDFTLEVDLFTRLGLPQVEPGPPPPSPLRRTS